METLAHVKKETLWPAFGLSLGAAVGVGLSRFSYALLLPSMLKSMNWSYTIAGSLNTANALGYVAGSVSAYILVRHVRPSHLFIVGLVVTVLSVLVTGLFSDILWLMTNRFLSGVSGAWVLACGAAVIAARFGHAGRRRMATGIFFAGAGIGIALSGIVVNPLIAGLGAPAWPQAWLALGVVGLIASVWPILEATKVMSAANAASPGRLRVDGLGPIFVGYFFFACGYIVYMTFIFAWMRTHGISWQFGTVAWTILGGGVALSPFIWRSALDSWNPIITLAASCSLTLVGTLAPTYFSSAPSILISALLFGLGMFIAPSSVSILVQRTMPPNDWAKGITMFVTIFSVGQAVGPIGAGWVADNYGLGTSLFVGAALLALASTLPLVSLLTVPVPASADS
jgi:predicted MFS family arabinose efflux permease